MRQELARMTDKLDNIRRLQEMGMLNSFRKFLNRNNLYFRHSNRISVCFQQLFLKQMAQYLEKISEIQGSEEQLEAEAQSIPRGRQLVQ